MNARLTDPYDCIDSARLAALNEKLSACQTRMYRKPQNGGNPFLFALTSSKMHEVRWELPGMPKDEKGAPTFQTAATDGKKFYWNPDFLEKLDPDEVTTVMLHESYHVIYFHPSRGRGYDNEIFNWTCDYVVNASIEHDHRETNRAGELWGGNLGEPLPLQEVLDYIDGKIEFKKGVVRMYADYSTHGRSPESMYDEIMNHWEKSPRKCTECGALSMDPKTGKSKIPKPWQPGSCVNCGAMPKNGSGYGVCPDLPSTTDAHLDSDMTREEVMTEVERAAQSAKMMRGNVPSGVEEALGELYEPTLTMHDLIRQARFRKIQNAGMHNDYSRYRRRPLALKPRIYLPRRHGHSARWLAMLDTSGSMSEDDLRYAISQLQVAGEQSEGFVVPVDAAPHWDGVTEVKNIEDLKRTKVVGRGGTVFDQFFAEFPERLGIDFDSLIILTDGDCGQIPLDLMPPMDVVWVLTRNHKEFEPNFGRVAPLRTDRPY